MAGVDTILSRLTRNTARATLKCSKCHFEFIRKHSYETHLKKHVELITLFLLDLHLCRQLASIDAKRARKNLQRNIIFFAI
ncbi:hypothetical protein JTE90_027595 [Oedothorax gibbosus]|uniref:C2H2-type domain-containing protein n=1 Tax=Oedothorax gibbosus TaxID=931172 RepID=A0AAV6VK98_9ARAC|nr:hypothetical protein JTE90_027595 [Oedothorax gibbosus]